MSREKLVSDFLRFLSLNNIQELRINKYKYTLSKTFEMLNVEPEKATKADIQELVNKIDNSNYKEWTKHDYRVVIKKFFTWLYNQDIDIDEWETPCLVKWIKIKRPKCAKKLPSELITPQDIQLLVENSRGLREKALILTLYESGARIGELLNLKIKDVVFDDYGCKLNLFGKTGYRQVRLVGSEPAVAQWINLEHPCKKDKNSFLFCNTGPKREGKKLSYQALAKYMKQLKRKTGFNKDLNFHQFRHSRATELAEYLTDAQRCNYFGWEAGSQICRVYTHLADTDRAILELNGLVEKDKDKNGKFKNIICPRCNTNNAYGSEICSSCNLGLDLYSIEKYEERDKLIRKITTPEELDDFLGNKLMQLLEEKGVDVEKLVKK